MDGWKITFSPGGFTCQARWVGRDGNGWACDELIPSGYVIAQHRDRPDVKMCLNCMIAKVRIYLRKKELD